MPVINKPPQIVERKYQLEDIVADAADQCCGQIGSTADHVVNAALRRCFGETRAFWPGGNRRDGARKGSTAKPSTKP